MSATAIYDNLTIATEDMRNYCRADPDDTELIERLIKAVKRKADMFCGNPFTQYKDAHGAIQIPQDVEQWVYETVARKYERRSSGVVNARMDGVGAIVWAEEDFDDLWFYRILPGTD